MCSTGKICHGFFVINKIKPKLKCHSIHLNLVKPNDGKFGFVMRYRRNIKLLFSKTCSYKFGFVIPPVGGQHRAVAIKPLLGLLDIAGANSSDRK